MSNYQFPKDLKLDIQPYMIFSAFQWSMRGKKTQDIKSIQKARDSIILPISTNGIVDSINNNWEEGVGIADVNLKDVFLRKLASSVSEGLGDLLITDEGIDRAAVEMLEAADVELSLASLGDVG